MNAARSGGLARFVTQCLPPSRRPLRRLRQSSSRSVVQSPPDVSLYTPAFTPSGAWCVQPRCLPHSSTYLSTTSVLDPTSDPGPGPWTLFPFPLPPFPIHGTGPGGVSPVRGSEPITPARGQRRSPRLAWEGVQAPARALWCEGGGIAGRLSHGSSWSIVPVNAGLGRPGAWMYSGRAFASAAARTGGAALADEEEGSGRRVLCRSWGTPLEKHHHSPVDIERRPWGGRLGATG